ncbi:anion-transporting ATPase domain-containing protein [Ditylenchus destructor]|nr:anion-transporting ATPase domain-containing protein [Ditylenchus destructor]
MDPQPPESSSSRRQLRTKKARQAARANKAAEAKKKKEHSEKIAVSKQTSVGAARPIPEIDGNIWIAVAGDKGGDYTKLSLVFGNTYGPVNQIQQKYLDQIAELYDDFHITKLPLLECEVRGPQQIREFSERLAKPELNEI